METRFAAKSSSANLPKKLKFAEMLKKFLSSSDELKVPLNGGGYRGKEVPGTQDNTEVFYHAY